MFRYLHFSIHVNISLFHWVYFTSFFDHYIAQNICFYSFRCSALFLLKLQALDLQLYKIELLHCFFFKNFGHTLSLILFRTTILKNTYFCRTLLQWLLLFIHYIPMINTYLFLVLKLLHAIAESCQIN